MPFRMVSESGRPRGLTYTEVRQRMGNYCQKPGDVPLMTDFYKYKVMEPDPSA